MSIMERSLMQRKKQSSQDSSSVLHHSSQHGKQLREVNHYLIQSIHRTKQSSILAKKTQQRALNKKLQKSIHLLLKILQVELLEEDYSQIQTKVVGLYSQHRINQVLKVKLLEHLISQINLQTPIQIFLRKKIKINHKKQLKQRIKKRLPSQILKKLLDSVNFLQLQMFLHSQPNKAMRRMIKNQRIQKKQHRQSNKSTKNPKIQKSQKSKINLLQKSKSNNKQHHRKNQHNKKLKTKRKLFNQIFRKIINQPQQSHYSYHQLKIQRTACLKLHKLSRFRKMIKNCRVQSQSSNPHKIQISCHNQRVKKLQIPQLKINRNKSLQVKRRLQLKHHLISKIRKLVKKLRNFLNKNLQELNQEKNKLQNSKSQMKKLKNKVPKRKILNHKNQ